MTVAGNGAKPQGRDLSVRLGDIQPFLALGAKLPSGLWASLHTQSEDPDPRISLADCFRMMRELAVVARDETFSLSARPLVMGSAEFVFASAASTRTLGEAIRKVAQAYNILHGGDYNRIEQRGSSLVYLMDDELFPYTQPRDGYLHFSLECALIFLHGALCELTGSDLTASVKQVTTRRPRGRRVDGALAFWDAPVTYGAKVYGLTYDVAVSSRPLIALKPNVAPDLAVHNRIVSLIEARQGADPRAAAYIDIVRRSIDDGLSDQREVAARLGVSVATLRRRLAAEGDTFLNLLHAQQNDEAKRRIREGASVAEVAEQLGFSDMRAFTRAFKGWNGLTPSAYRAAHADVSETVP